jgi:uncharacterized protein (DUF362 family)
MKRRDFLKSSLGIGAIAGAGFTLGSYGEMLAASNMLPPLYDLVAVKGGEPDVMFEKAIRSLGGMTAFVKKGQKVVVKPNIGWDVSPERGGDTNPKLIYSIVKHCLDAGAKEVFVFDNTCDNWAKCYKNSGIEKAVKDAGGKIAPGNSEANYQQVDVKNGKKLKKAKVHELILDSDVFINVPILKNHMAADVTISMKNLMGIVWDRQYWHRTDLHQCIADFTTFCKPDLNIVDAYRVMMKNGPRGVSEKDISLMKQMVISKDILAADAASVKIFGKEPEDISYIQIAKEMKLGRTDLKNMKINRIIL